MAFWKPGSDAPGTHTGSTRTRHANNNLNRGIGNKEDEDIPVPGLFGPDALLSIADQRQRLPAFRSRDQFLFLVESFQVVIVAGQTGSGKSTQLPQYLLEAGWCTPRPDGRTTAIACTQPRRVAATSVAARVAEERSCALGETVGYSVRFDDRSDPRITRIKFLTDGMLFREILIDPLLSSYSVIIIDEAHERSLYTDILLGVIKKVLKKRPELRIIISSATLDANLFKAFFNTNTSGDPVKDTAVAMSLDGRMFPVDIFYLQSPCTDYVRESVNTVLKIHKYEPQGDVLVFLTGRDEVENAVSLIREEHELVDPKGTRPLLVVPLYGGLTLDEQRLAFAPAPRATRKVVVSTNIAEASVTIDGIAYVVDSGFIKVRSYSPESGIDTLVVVPASQASAQQRAGRSGRTRPGKAFRLYTEDAFASLPVASIPEIQRSNLGSLLLQLKAIGIENVLRFDFLSPPPSETMSRALELLYSLKALDDYGRLSMPLGSTLAEMPLDPMLGTMILNSHRFGCSEETLTVAAVLSVEPIFITPSGHRHEADEAKRQFAVEEGDHITSINVFNAFIRAKKNPRWCHSHFLNYHALNRAVSVRGQLRKYLKRFGVDRLVSCGEDTDVVRRCVVSGFFAHAAKMQPDGTYVTLRDNKSLSIHPNSVLFKRTPAWVVFHEVVETTKPYMRDVLSIDPEWLPELAPHFYRMGAEAALKMSNR